MAALVSNSNQKC